jgi:DNA integrity scanning protein DisA with diadenylate cyclase activity
VALPYANCPMKNDYAIVVGRNVKGIKYDAARGAHTYIIVLVLSKSKDDKSHIELRSEIASFFKSNVIQEKILSSKRAVNIMNLVSSYETDNTNKGKTKATRRAKKYHNPIISYSMLLANEIKASTLVFFADTVTDNDFLNSIKTRKKIIVITNNKSRFEKDDKRFSELIQSPSFPASRTDQIKIGILLAISRSLIKKKDKVVCISGNSNIGEFDTIVTIDVEKEYEFFFGATRSIIPSDVQPEVLERVLGIASEIAVEGREGKPTGTIFVVGDTNSVNVYVRQLIINPFRGYSEAERNILDPGLDETIKEFSSIDGAFIITGDGVVLSAGSYLRPPGDGEEIGKLPSGFGARHAAAAGITVCTNALAITISESTGMVSIFKNGTIMLTLAKQISQSKSSVR